MCPPRKIFLDSHIPTRGALGKNDVSSELWASINEFSALI